MGLGRREPIVLVSSRRGVECPPNICRGVRLVGRPMLAAKQFPRIFTFQTEDEGLKRSNTPLIPRFRISLLIRDLEQNVRFIYMRFLIGFLMYER